MKCIRRLFFNYLKECPVFYDWLGRFLDVSERNYSQPRRAWCHLEYSPFRGWHFCLGNLHLWFISTATGKLQTPKSAARKRKKKFLKTLTLVLGRVILDIFRDFLVWFQNQLCCGVDREVVLYPADWQWEPSCLLMSTNRQLDLRRKQSIFMSHDSDKGLPVSRPPGPPVIC